MMFVSVLVAIALTIVAWEFLTSGGRFMALVQDLLDAITAAGVSVQALADAFKAKSAGIDPASLDPVLAAANQLKAVADADVNPPAPGA